MSGDSSFSGQAEVQPVRLSDHVDVHAMSHDDEKAVPASTPTPTPTPSRPSSFFDLRIAVVGNVDSGKSTIIGVLTGGAVDNGRGLARSRVFLHKHESATGRTSCISQHIMGYDAALSPVYNPSSASSSAAVKNKSWSSVVSSSSHIVTFIDLAGHERYLKTTIAGLTGCFPDYALIVINSLAGITKMTREHLGVVLALSIPLIVVVTKVDLASSHILGQTKAQLFKVLKSGGGQQAARADALFQGRGHGHRRRGRQGLPRLLRVLRDGRAHRPPARVHQQAQGQAHGLGSRWQAGQGRQEGMGSRRRRVGRVEGRVGRR